MLKVSALRKLFKRKAQKQNQRQLLREQENARAKQDRWHKQLGLSIGGKKWWD